MLNDWLIPLLKKLECNSFIDIGCGFGDHAGMVKELLPDVRVVGIDIAKGFIDEAKNTYPQVVYKAVDILDKPFEKNEFDVAHTHGLLIHIQHDKILEALYHIMRIAKVGIFCESQGKETPGLLTYKPKEYWEKRTGRDKPDMTDLNTQYYFKHDYKEIFKQLGLKVKIIKDYKDINKTRIYKCQK